MIFLKIDRHAKILQLIQENIVETQDDLADFLKNEGINVTQATVSRDIRELKLIKILDESGRYKYASYDPDSDGIVLDSRIAAIFREAVLTIDYASNIVCMHTITGMANAAAVAVDLFKDTSILGCVAGDDTIFVLLRDEKKAAELTDTFKHLLKK